MKSAKLYFATMYALSKGENPVWEINNVRGPFENIFQIGEAVGKLSPRGEIKSILVFEGVMFSVGEKGQLKPIPSSEQVISIQK
jgi:hypothetical protein